MLLLKQYGDNKMIQRKIQAELAQLAEEYKVVTITGPRHITRYNRRA